MVYKDKATDIFRGARKIGKIFNETNDQIHQLLLRKGPITIKQIQKEIGMGSYRYVYDAVQVLVNNGFAKQEKVWSKKKRRGRRSLLITAVPLNEALNRAYEIMGIPIDKNSKIK